MTDKNIIITSISDEPFWRPPDRERTCSSGVRLGGFTKDTEEQLKKKLAEIERKQKIIFNKDIRSQKWQEEVSYLCKEEQKIRKKLREMKKKL